MASVAQKGFERYKDWLIRHELSLGVIESSLEYILEATTWLVASRSDDAVLAGEGCAVAVDLWRLFNESILKPGDQLPRWLAVLETVGFLVEAAAVRREAEGGSSRYNALAAYESTRAALQLLILYRQGGRLRLRSHSLGHAAASARRSLVSGQAQQFLHALRRFRAQAQQHVGGRSGSATLSASEPTSADEAAQKAGLQTAGTTELSGASTRERPSPLWWNAQRGQATGQPDSAQDGEDPQLEGTSPTPSDAEARAEAHMAKRQNLALSLVVVGEMMRIVRRPVYALALRSHGHTSWRPWLLSLAMDLAAGKLVEGGAALSQRIATSAATNPALQHGSVASLHRMQAIRWTPEECDELQRRRMQLFFYLIRDPVWGRLILPRVEAVFGTGIVAQFCIEPLKYWQGYFTWLNAT